MKIDLGYLPLIIFIFIIDSGLGHTWAIVGFFVWALFMPVYNYVMIPKVREFVNETIIIIVRQLELMIWGHTNDRTEPKGNNKKAKVVVNCKEWETISEERETTLQQNVQEMSNSKSKRTKDKP